MKSDVDGKHYFSYDPGAIVEFGETKGFVAKTDENWKRVRKVLGTK